MYLNEALTLPYEIALATHTDIDVVRSWDMDKFNRWVAFFAVKAIKAEEASK